MVPTRLRSISPKLLLEDERIASLSHTEWRLFTSMWLLADDYGNLSTEPLLLKTMVFMRDRELNGEAVATMVGRLVDSDLLETYDVHGESYGHLSDWVKPQRAGKPRVPKPTDSAAATTGPTELWTYFFQSEGPGTPVKIGQSSSPRNRLSAIACAMPYKVNMVGLLRGNREKEMHVRFHYQRLEGEWFRPSKALLEFIASEASVELLPYQT